VNSYHKGYAWTDEITQGVETALNKNNTELHIEYMDTKRQFDSVYLKLLTNLLEFKHKKHKYEVIITSDNNAFNFIKTNRNNIFNKVPIVFCGVNYLQANDLIGIENITGINEKADIQGNISLIKNLHPNCNKIVVITDNTTTGKRIQKEVSIIKKNTSINSPKIELLFDITASQLTHHIKLLKEGSVVLLTIFFRDKNNEFFEYDEGAKMICSNTKVPVYGTWTFSMNYGIVGGILTDGYEQGKLAGELAMKILQGAKADEIPVICNPPVTNMFDYRELKKHNINIDKLPKDSLIKYRPPTFLQKNKKLIRNLTLVIAFLTTIIAILVIALRRINNARRLYQTSQDQLRTIINTLPSQVFIKNNEGRFLMANNTFKNFYNLNNNDPVGKLLIDIHPHTDEVTNMLLEDQEALKTPHSIIIGENRFKNKNGEQRWFRTIKLACPPNLFGEPAVLGTYLDITDQKQAELELISANEKLSNTNEKLVYTTNKLQQVNLDLVKALEEAKKSKELENANKLLTIQKEEIHATLNALKKTQSQLIQSEKLASVGILISGIAHEINNPLNFIRGGKFAIELYINDHLESHIENLKPLFEIIETGVIRASNIVQNLDKFSYKSNELWKPFDLHLLIDNCLLMLEHKLKNKIDVIKNFHNDSLIVFGNEGSLHQVFLNILINAEQAIEKKGTITINTTEYDSKITCTILDTGCGISKDNLNKICDPFFTTKPPGKGIGLGLSISHSILNDHKGSLEFKSEKNVGTEITVTLPAYINSVDNKTKA